MEIINKIIIITCLTCLTCLISVQANSKEKTGFFSSSLRDGPVTICSDSVMYDQSNGTAIYKGNVLAIQIKGVDILCHGNLKGDSSLTYQLHNKHHELLDVNTTKDYSTMSKEELTIAKRICFQYGSCHYISGQKLIIKMNKSNRVKSITMTINESSNRAKYYSLGARKKVR